MESFEFLGGRYNQPEQIMSGPVQAFRAQSAATGRMVFVHRVSTTESPEEQATLLKLLTTALVKSADAKRLVLDFGEESGYWYVVTESEPQCALLREWLQLEIEAAASNSRVGVPSPAPPDTKASAPPAFSTQPSGETGEFTRFLKARPSLTSPPSTARLIPRPPPAPPAAPAPVASGPPPTQPPSPPSAKPESGPSEFTQLFQKPGTPAGPAPPAPIAGAPPLTQRPSPAPVQRPNSGEFTSFFKTADSEHKQPRQSSSSTPQRPPVAAPPPKAPPPAVPAQGETGEFTRFFSSGLPPTPPKPPVSPAQGIAPERSQKASFVQRPNTPVPPPSGESPPKQAGPGEFTQLFSRPGKPSPSGGSAAPNFQPPPAPLSDPLGFASRPASKSNDLTDDLFNDRIDIPSPLPSSGPQQSEFTRMFGSSGSSSPPLQPPAVVAPPRDKPLLDERANENALHPTQQFSSVKPSADDAPPAHSPSEFTMIMQGGYGPPKPPGGAANSPAGEAAGPKGGPGAPLLNVNVSPVNPASAMPHLGSAGGSVAGAHGQISQSGASAGSAFGSASVAGPHVPAPQLRVPSPTVPIPPPKAGGANKNKKMIIFFIVLGVLALVLVLLMLFLMKSK